MTAWQLVGESQPVGPVAAVWLACFLTWWVPPPLTGGLGLFVVAWNVYPASPFPRPYFRGEVWVEAFGSGCVQCGSAACSEPGHVTPWCPLVVYVPRVPVLPMVFPWSPGVTRHFWRVSCCSRGIPLLLGGSWCF